MDEKDLQNARQAYSMLCASLDDIGNHYQQNDEDLDVHFEVHGDGLPMELTISIDGERDLIRLLSFLPFKVKPERIQEIALGVCKINDILINGNFDLGIEKGRLTFRMVQSYRDSLIDMEVFKYMIYVSLKTIDEYSESCISSAGARSPWMSWRTTTRKPPLRRRPPPKMAARTTATNKPAGDRRRTPDPRLSRPGPLFERRPPHAVPDLYRAPGL